MPGTGRTRRVANERLFIVDTSVRRLKAILESDPGGLVRVLHFFQARNITPVRVTAERLGPALVNVVIDVAVDELPNDALQVIAAKIGEMSVSVCTVLCD